MKIHSAIIICFLLHCELTHVFAEPIPGAEAEPDAKPDPIDLGIFDPLKTPFELVNWKIKNTNLNTEGMGNWESIMYKVDMGGLRYNYNSDSQALSDLFKLSSEMSCSLCEKALKLGIGTSNKFIIWALRAYASLRSKPMAGVAASLMSTMGADLQRAINNSTDLEKMQICQFYLQVDCKTNDAPRHSWDVMIPEKETKQYHITEMPPIQRETFKVLQITDVHYDENYKQDKAVFCGEPLCCRNDHSESPSLFIKSGTKAGMWGSYIKCDTPLRLLENSLEHIAETHPDIDYIMFTGDAPPHDIWNQTAEANIHYFRDVNKIVHEYLGHKQIYPSVGNHESFPVDKFPPPGTAPIEESPTRLYNVVNQEWEKWLSLDDSSTVSRGGYYTKLVQPGFRIITINGNYCARFNFWLLVNSNDPTGQLAWLVRELEKAEANGEKVHIVGHIPPGGEDCLKNWSRNYYNIVNRFEHIIMAQFYGHTHYDEFEVFYDKDDNTRPINVGYVAPSLTPWENTDPAYRIYYVDKETKAIVDHETWKFDLAKSNYLLKPIWRKSYSARESYGMKSLLPKDWDDLIKRMTENRTLFDIYDGHYYSDSPVQFSCNGDCRKRRLCDMKSGRSVYANVLCKDLIPLKLN